MTSPIDEKFWRTYLESQGLSFSEIDEQIRSMQVDAAAAERRIEEALTFLERQDPERAARLRRELDEKGREYERQLDTLNERASRIVPEPDEPM